MRQACLVFRLRAYQRARKVLRLELTTSRVLVLLVVDHNHKPKERKTKTIALFFVYLTNSWFYR